MAFFRSEPMTLCQIILHTESAFNCLIELGYVGKVQFRNIYDGSAQPNHQFTPQIQRCHKLQRIMSHLQNEIDDFNIQTVIYPDVDKDEVPEANDLKTIETTVIKLYEDLTAIEANIGDLRKQRNQLYEHLDVIQKANQLMMGGHKVTQSDSGIMQPIRDDKRQRESESLMHVSFVTGTIPTTRYRTFETILWRVLRGNFHIKRLDIAIPRNDTQRISYQARRKYIFMIFFTGQVIKQKISKICQGFGIKIFDCPESNRERQGVILKMIQDLYDLELVLQQTQKQRHSILLIASADLYVWQVNVKKISMVYYVLNRMSSFQNLEIAKYLQVECWIPTKDITLVRSVLILGARRTAKGSSHNLFIPILHELKLTDPIDFVEPTYFSLNRFTKGFQNLVDTYGIAEYQELNPAPYTIITFPFLFAVMFGDMGHGLLMLIFGLWMLIKEKSLEVKTRLSTKPNEIWNIFFNGRYIKTLMGAFSIYTGLIYNDCFSKSLNMFGSSWQINASEISFNETHELNPQNPKHYLGVPYILGIDPIWDASGENAISALNSLKMKLAIILGVLHMIFGLTLSAVNYVHKRNYSDLFLVFLPQLIFFLSTFFYLIFLIFYKWSQYGGHNEPPFNSACAPSILIIFVNMLLMKGAEKPPPGCEIWMFEFQDIIQSLLLAIAVICIPILFAGKPIYFMLQEWKELRIQNEALRISRHRLTITNFRKSLIYSIDSHTFSLDSETYKNKLKIGELWLHSGIHCIETILSSISHTASYLRLWALSLAHDQLSTILWKMILKIGLTSKLGYFNSVVLYVMFILWATLTVAILVVMEGLSAFLHTLRLHWVEFQSKFYAGSGERFTPFQFKPSSGNF